MVDFGYKEGKGFGKWVVGSIFLFNFFGNIIFQDYIFDKLEIMRWVYFFNK